MKTGRFDLYPLACSISWVERTSFSQKQKYSPPFFIYLFSYITLFYFYATPLDPENPEIYVIGLKPYLTDNRENSRPENLRPLSVQMFTGMPYLANIVPIVLMSVVYDVS